MTEEEHQEREALYSRICDTVCRAVMDFPEAKLVAPEGFQSILSGISQVWGKKGTPGIMIHSDSEGLILDISVSLASASSLAETGKQLQNTVWKSLQPLTLQIRAVNIDILKVEK